MIGAVKERPGVRKASKKTERAAWRSQAGNVARDRRTANCGQGLSMVSLKQIEKMI